MIDSKTDEWFSHLLTHMKHCSLWIFQADICSMSLVEIIQAVVGGSDGCLFCYGHARLGQLQPVRTSFRQNELNIT